MDDLARVLIADADQVQRDSLLTNAGFRVLQAETVDQALALRGPARPKP